MHEGAVAVGEGMEAAVGVRAEKRDAADDGEAAGARRERRAVGLLGFLGAEEAVEG